MESASISYTHVPYFTTSDHSDCLYHLWIFWCYQMAATLWCRTCSYYFISQITIVTKCLLKFLYKHHATCNKKKSMQDYDRKVAKQQNDHKHCPFKWRAVPRLYLRSCLFLYASRTMIQYFAVAERHTEREVHVYTINILHDETDGVYVTWFKSRC